MAGAAAGAPPHPQAGASQPQAGSHPQAGSWQQPLSQPLSQPQPLLQPNLPNSLSNSPPCFLEPQQLSHEGASQPQAGSQHDGASQPQAGSQHDGASQPQAGSAHPQAGASHPQAGSQPLSQPLSHPQLFLQEKSLLSNPPCFFFAQGSQQESHDGASQPQAGSQHDGAPQVGASQPQAGSAHPHAGASQPQAGSHGESQHPVSQQLLALPQPLTPSIRSKRSKPKLWLQRLQPRTRAIVIIVRFIGATSPLSQFRGLISWWSIRVEDRFARSA
jgi:hypothetical protein